MNCSRRSVVGFLALAVSMFSAGCFGSGGGGAGSTSATTLQAATGYGPASVQMVNSSNEAIYYIHMSPTSQSTWGPDLLGNQVLQRGQSFNIGNIGAGNWDIRVVDQSRNYKEWRNVYIEPGGSYQIVVSAGGWQR
jgi:hypothetical protein